MNYTIRGRVVYSECSLKHEGCEGRIHYLKAVYDEPFENCDYEIRTVCHKHLRGHDHWIEVSGFLEWCREAVQKVDE